MPDKAKMPLIIMALLIVASLLLAGSGFYLLQQEKTRNLMLQGQLESLKIKQEAAEGKLIEYNKTISQLELKLKDTQTEVYTLTENLEQEKKAKEQAVAESLQLQQSLQQHIGVAKDLETKLQQVQKDAEKIMLKLRTITSEKTELEVKIKALEAQAQQMQTQPAAQGQDVELGTIVVVPEDTGAAPQPKTAAVASKKEPVKKAVKQPKEQVAKQPKEQVAISLGGKVLVVNKEYNFIVISLGSRDGVKPGDIFGLYQGSRYLGDVKVAKTHDSMSAADFLTSSIKDAVREGDKVVQKTK